MSFLPSSRPLARLPHKKWSITHNHAIRHLVVPPLSPLHEDSHAPAVDPEKLSHLKRPQRAGQDLSHRYRRLERSLRGKISYGREIQDHNEQRLGGTHAPYTAEESQAANPSAGKTTRRIYKGFVIPEPPKPPAEDECCMSGCAVCVYDLYDEARNDYLQALQTLRSGLNKLSVPESEWPGDIRYDWQGGQTSPVSRQDVTLSAFEQLEQALKAKREGSGRIEASMAPPIALKRPPKKGMGMNDVYEGLRWVMFSNR